MAFDCLDELAGLDHVVNVRLAFDSLWRFCQRRRIAYDQIPLHRDVQSSAQAIAAVLHCGRR